MATETYRRNALDPNAGRTVARERFGGVDVPASLTGMLVAVAMELILGGLVAAAVTAFGFQFGFTENATELSIGGAIAGYAVMFVAFLVGGWAAGRMARYDGMRNGLMTAVWALLLAAVLVGLGLWLGERYDVLAQVRLPQWATEAEVTTGAVIGGLVAIALMLVGGAIGGAWGAAYHRRADRLVTEGTVAETIASETPAATTEPARTVVREDRDADGVTDTETVVEDRDRDGTTDTATVVEDRDRDGRADTKRIES